MQLLSVRGCIDQVMSDGVEDDDAPLVFRRPNSWPKQGRSTSALKKTNPPSLPAQPAAPHNPKPSSSSSSSLPQSMKLNSNSEEADDSEDEKPLLLRLESKALDKKGTNSKTSSSRSEEKRSRNEEIDDSEDENPLLLRLQSKALNGSARVGVKRPHGDTNPTESSPIKKAKFSGTSVLLKVKQEDDGERKPTARAIMKSPSFSKLLKTPPGSQKWTTLEHNGVIFSPPYKPHGTKMLYKGRPIDLTPEQDEVATMFAVMKGTDYSRKTQLIENFMHDWRLILGKDHIIKRFEDCDFTPIYEWHLEEKEKKQMTAEEKKAVKEEKLTQEEKYTWAIVDGVKEKVGNFRVEPPGLFRGRGEDPKMGKLKMRIRPRDITINIGKEAPIPECSIPGERWKEVKHDNTVTWLAFCNDPINPKEFKYVFLAASSSLKGQSDKEKYEKARLLEDYIRSIRTNYTKDFTSKDPTKQQIAVATYLIDKLALRGGNEKDDDEADTVGCCTLKKFLSIDVT